MGERERERQLPSRKGFFDRVSEPLTRASLGVDRGEWSAQIGRPAHEGRRMAGNDFPLVTTFVNPEPDHTHTGDLEARQPAMK